MVAAVNGDGEMKRKQLRKAVLQRYLGHLSSTSQAGDAAEEDRRWWEGHPAALKALFKKKLKKASKGGRLIKQGKMVRCP